MSESTKDYLLICSCSGREEKARKALSFIHPASEPEVVKGKSAIAKLASKYSNDHIKAIAKLGGSFSYFIRLDEDGNIIEEYDLIEGRRIA